MEHVDWKETKIDLLIGGSPCQGFSFAGKQINFEDPRSKLFFEFVRILREIRKNTPGVLFLLENVKMKKEYQDLISSMLGVSPVEINSSLVSAQNRKRLYWTNIPIKPLQDRGIMLGDVIDIGGENEIYVSKGRLVGRRIDSSGTRKDSSKDIELRQYLEVRSLYGNKSNCLTTVEKDNVISDMEPGRYPGAFDELKDRWRYLSVKEYCRLQTMPEEYFEGVISDRQAKKCLGNGWTVDVVSEIFKNIKHII